MPPGRVDSRRPVPVRFWLRAAGTLALALALSFSACATGRPSPPRELAPVWRDYRALPEQRALAIAGDLRHGRWVAGASGGHALPGEAESAALQECRRRRVQQRMQAPCRVYAVGDEVVWPGAGRW